MSKWWYNDKDSELGKYQRELESVAKSPTFCVLPWIHFATRPNGDMRLCCSSNARGAGGDHTVGLVKWKTASQQTLAAKRQWKHGITNT